MENGKKRYESPRLEMIGINIADVITTSIGKDEGELDGEWAPYGTANKGDVGIWN